MGGRQIVGGLQLDNVSGSRTLSRLQNKNDRQRQTLEHISLHPAPPLALSIYFYTLLWDSGRNRRCIGRAHPSSIRGPFSPQGSLRAVSRATSLIKYRREPQGQLGEEKEEAPDHAQGDEEGRTPWYIRAYGLLRDIFDDEDADRHRRDHYADHQNHPSTMPNQMGLKPSLRTAG